MNNSIIGIGFVYHQVPTIILDEAVIVGNLDSWKFSIKLSTNKGDLAFEIIDYYTYFNRRIYSITESRVRELLIKIFNDLSKLDNFSGFKNNDCYEYPEKDRYQIARVYI